MKGMRRRSLQGASAEWRKNGSGKRLVYLTDLSSHRICNASQPGATSSARGSQFVFNAARLSSCRAMMRLSKWTLGL
jgi:hypothetical protein